MFFFILKGLSNTLNLVLLFRAGTLNSSLLQLSVLGQHREVRDSKQLVLLSHHKIPHISDVTRKEYLHNNGYEVTTLHHIYVNCFYGGTSSIWECNG